MLLMACMGYSLLVSRHARERTLSAHDGSIRSVGNGHEQLGCRQSRLSMRGASGTAGIGRERDAAARLGGETTAQNVARYLAGEWPAIETGRQLSLEHVAIVGLRTG
ncbi:hypothetical protein D3C71_1820740 [compost metagenome]